MGDWDRGGERIKGFEKQRGQSEGERFNEDNAEEREGLGEKMRGKREGG